ncbi:hypothetical protein [Pseudonocardia endophytica]|uniref:Uncharacterized protein n=1 Tax=Pseudonocardia endophytica TaxID=401976 RepID=A0A4R1HGX9_PSEEN|nr:hypothetical protein [Pseudonocardia endophytica]TCK21454.1 hypothetical protein EV378_5440 [Pseudonocardia endophytica]
MTATPATPTDLVPSSQDLGANMVTFTGDRTTITFFPETPGPLQPGHEGGKLTYEGPEGTIERFGADIARVDSPLGYLLTIVLRPDDDTGQIDLTVLLPRVVGVAMEAPVVFAAMAIRTHRRGFVANPGPVLGYDVLPLVAKAEEVIIAL